MRWRDGNLEGVGEVEEGREYEVREEEEGKEREGRGVNRWRKEQKEKGGKIG